VQVTTIGLDIAKHVFQVHGIDQDGQVLIRRQLRRSGLIGFFRRLPSCLIGMGACSTAHFWARELAALGHEVRLIPAAYVKRGKSEWVGQTLVPLWRVIMSQLHPRVGGADSPSILPRRPHMASSPRRRGRLMYPAERPKPSGFIPA
jgi:hypothetical protein